MDTSTEKIISIVHVCHQDIVKSAIISCLEKDRSIQVIGEAANGKELWALLEQTRPDIVILELFIPNENGFQIIDNIKKQYPDISIVILTYVDKPDIIEKALNAGVGAYVTYSDEPVEIISAIYSCLDSKFFISTLAKRKLSS
jgi:DNA-binding NarL/FixJ family response regulator